MHKYFLTLAVAAGMALSGSTALAGVNAGLPCAASASPRNPTQYSNVTIRVDTAARADVTAVAHYRTTDTTEKAVANRAGVAKPVFYIASATVGYRVVVDVTVTKGARSNTCQTSFTPRAA